MAVLAVPRRKLLRYLNTKVILLAVPAVWLVIIIWTLYNTQVVQDKQSIKQLVHTLQNQPQEGFHALRPGDEVTDTTPPPMLRVKDGSEREQQDNEMMGPLVMPDDDQVQGQRSDIGQELPPDNYGMKDTDKDDDGVDVNQNNDDDSDGFGPVDGAGYKEENKNYPVPEAIQDFVAGQKNRSRGMLFVQPEPEPWDASIDIDHIEVTPTKIESGPNKKTIVPGYRFDPPKLGELGRAVKVNPDELDVGERAKFDEGWKNHHYNEYVSLQISTQRRIPDFRNMECKKQTYPKNLPKASIIICFYNEGWTVLLRTIHSVLNRSPPELITEIILVDDFSDMVTMQKPLEYYAAQVSKIRLLRMTKRSGLVRARLAGVKEAKGPVILFLDSHVECAEGWLPPLLETIATRPNFAVTPEIDVIDHRTFAVQMSLDNLGVLEFSSFSFDWSQIMPRIMNKRTSEADPIESPAMAGGLFAIRKDYFLSLGTYDPGLVLWGGENIELSLKLWMCGGGILIHPCSRVAHIFRETSPYLKGKNANVLQRNSARVAEVWADDYKKFFFKNTPYKESEYGSVEERKQLRSRLKCHSFGWYLDNVYPEMHIPGTGKYKGKIKSSNGKCIHKADTASDSPLVLISCYSAMHWEYTRIKEIRVLNLCMDRPNKRPKITTRHCDQQSKTQVFEYTQKKTIFHPVSSSCLTMEADGRSLVFQPCDGSGAQVWDWAVNHDHIPTAVD